MITLVNSHLFKIEETEIAGKGIMINIRIAPPNGMKYTETLPFASVWVTGYDENIKMLCNTHDATATVLYNEFVYPCKFIKKCEDSADRLNIIKALDKTDILISDYLFIVDASKIDKYPREDQDHAYVIAACPIDGVMQPIRRDPGYSLIRGSFVVANPFSNVRLTPRKIIEISTLTYLISDVYTNMPVSVYKKSSYIQDGEEVPFNYIEQYDFYYHDNSRYVREQTHQYNVIPSLKYLPKLAKRFKVNTHEKLFYVNDLPTYVNKSSDGSLTTRISDSSDDSDELTFQERGELYSAGCR